MKNLNFILATYTHTPKTDIPQVNHTSKPQKKEDVLFGATLNLSKRKIHGEGLNLELKIRLALFDPHAVATVPMNMLPWEQN